MCFRRAWPSSAACLVLACASANPAPLSSRVESAPSAPPPAAVDAGVADAAEVYLDAAQGIGDAGPLRWLGASATGSWVAVCQPAPGLESDAGARWQRTVVLANGSALRVSEVAAADPRGRFLVALREGRFELIDAEQGTQVLLAADVDARRVAGNFVSHRSFAFDGVGRRLAYLIRRAGKTRVIIRTLASGSELLGPPLDLEPLRLGFVGASPETLVLYGVAQDTNGDGKRSLPAALSRDPGECQAADRFVASAPIAGDAVQPHLVNEVTAVANPAPGFVLRFGADQILRDERDRLLRRVGSSESVLADEDCGARILAANRKQKALLVACYKTPGRAPLRLLGSQQSIELGADLAFAGDDLLSQLDTDLFAVHPGKSAALVDLGQGVMRALGDDRLVLSVRGRFALVRHGSRLLGVSVPASPAAQVAERVLVEGLANVADVVLGERHLVVDGHVVDRATGRVSGRVRPGALSVDVHGRVLVAAEVTDAGPQGPLRYESPH